MSFLGVGFWELMVLIKIRLNLEYRDRGNGK